MKSRRDFLATSLGAMTAICQMGSTAIGAEVSGSSSGKSPKYQPKPLPFTASKLDGISEKLIVSHHDNNYAGAVKRLNSIQEKIASLPMDAAPYLMGSLKREELVAMNSMILHEIYFDNLGGNGIPGSKIKSLLARDFGSVEAWERQFKLTGQSLSGGSGWVLLAYSPYDKCLHNVWMADHTTNLAGGLPVLAMDMYEHAYQMDHGANAKAYIDNFFKNINWEIVESRAAAALG